MFICCGTLLEASDGESLIITVLGRFVGACAGSAVCYRFSLPACVCAFVQHRDLSNGFIRIGVDFGIHKCCLSRCVVAVKDNW